MDLWIRSQDKYTMAKINEKITIIDYSGLKESMDKSLFSVFLQNNQVKEFLKYDNGWGLVVDNTCLGIYPTKERALEVLDEIEKILKPILVINNAKNEEGIECAKRIKIADYITTQNNGNIKILKDTYVYQMPEE